MAAYTLSLLLITSTWFLMRFTQDIQLIDNITLFKTSMNVLKCNNIHQRKTVSRSPNTNPDGSGKYLLILILLLSNDVHPNPGPCNGNIYPCGLCDVPVNWSDKAVCCDNCSIWHHASCMGLGQDDYSHLNKSSVSWECYKCNYTNLDSFTFNSYSISDHSSNYYFPLSDDSVNSLPFSTFNSKSSPKSPFQSNHETASPCKSFSPLKTSTPDSQSPKPIPSKNSFETPKNKSSFQKTPSPTTSPSTQSTSRKPSQDLHDTSPQKKSLRILNINAQSIRGKLSELQALLQYTKPDVVCITETWLSGKKPGQNHTKDAILDSEINSPNYKIYRKDRNLTGGGVLIMVHKSLTSLEEPTLMTDCEIEWVKISLKNTKDLFIGCFYMPHRNEHDIKELQKSIDKLTNIRHKHIIICGDFNCPDIDWTTCCIKNNACNREVHQMLLDITTEHCLTQLVEEPTRHENTLDLCFTSNSTLIKNVQVIPGISDHSIVIIDSNIKPEKQTPQKRKVFKFSKADWSTIKNECREISDELTNKTKDIDINTLWETFKTKLKNVTTKNIPSKSVTSRNSVPWMNNKLKSMIRKKARLHKQAKKTKNWANYRFHQKETKKAFRKAEIKFINNKIEEGLAQNNTKPFWKYVKSKKQDNVGVQPLLQNDRLISDSKSKSEVLLNQFRSVFTKPQKTEKPQVKKYINSSLDHITITIPGVTKLLSKIKTDKASGPDEIPNILLKECAAELAPAVAFLFQRSIDSGILPADWTNANVVPVFKKGDRHRAENYRPVSLTSVLSKLLEHVVCHAMMAHFEKHNVLTSRNHGFRAGYSPETQLIVTVNDLAQRFDKGQQTDIAVLDFSKAFDTVPHDRLLHKLHSYGVRGQLHTWVTSFLTTRKMRVIVDGETSSEADVISGVPQGTVLGPILFLVHINDLPDSVSSSVRLFADDCLVYRSINSMQDHIALQKDLHSLEEWADTWGMKFNATKCYILSTKKKSNFFYQLNNTILKEVDSNPYLGLTIANDLKWNQHINGVCKKASSALGFIRRNLQNCPKETRLTAYLSLVRPLLEYGATIWDPYTKKEIDKVESIQRQAARFIARDYHSRDTGCVTKMLDDLKLPPLQLRRRNLRLQFFYKVVSGLLPAINPNEYLDPIVNKRKIKAKTFDTCVSKNIVRQFETRNSRSYKIPTNKGTEQYKYSFFVRTIPEWNGLSDQSVTAESIATFKTRLSSDSIN